MSGKKNLRQAMAATVRKVAAEETRRLIANINAALQEKPLPYPPAKECCPYCGKEI